MKSNQSAHEKDFEIDREWTIWLEKNLVLDVPTPLITSALIERGCPKSLAEPLVKAFSLRKTTKAPDRDQRPAKAFWLLNTLRALQNLSSAGPIAERDTIDEDEFTQLFYTKNYPVLYRDCLCPAELADLLAWERLQRDFGALEVEIQEGRTETPEFERKSATLKSRMPLSDFLERAQTAEESNEFYMTANNASSNSTFINSAIDPTLICPGILDPSAAADHTFLWIGPRGTFTPSHHDLTNNLFIQVKGSKEFRLASSLALTEMKNDAHCYSSMSLAKIDAQRLDSNLPPLSFSVRLNEGDILFIPLGWWHEATGLSPSISISATNFRLKNDFFLEYDFYENLIG